MIAWEAQYMAFFSTFISTVLKMLFIGVFAVVGVLTGKKLRERKDAKNPETKQNGKEWIPFLGICFFFGCVDHFKQKVRRLNPSYIDKPSKSLYNQNLADRSEEDKDESLRS